MSAIDFTKPITYPKALKLPFHITPTTTLTLLAFQLINLIIAPFNVLILAHFINTAQEVLTQAGDWNRILLPLLLLAIVNLYTNIASPFLGLLALKQQQKAWLAIDHPLVKTYTSLQIKHTENRETTDLVHRVLDANAPHNILMNIWGNFSSFIFNICMIASYLIILMLNAPLAGVFIIIATPPVMVLSKKAAKEKYKTQQDLSTHSRMRGLHLRFLRMRESAAERKIFGFMPMLQQKYLEIFQIIRKLTFKVDIKWMLVDNSIQLLLTGIGIVTLLLMLPSVQNGSISAGMFISLIGVLFLTLSNVVQNQSHFFKTFTIQREYLKEFNQYLMLGRTPGALDKMSQNPPTFKTLELRNVSFVYPGMQKQVLNNISLTIEAGRNYALVGANGSGKTTLAKLLLHMYDDYTGEILLNGISIREWEMSDIKAMLTAAFQDFMRFDISVADNIAVGNGMRSAETEIDHAINVVGLRTTIDKLKNGKDTLIGKIYDDSVELSGGQWQKIAMARAVVSPAQLKILDEPTAALDPMAEQEIYTQFDEISKDASTIFISHRLASAKMADEIFVLDNGNLVEQGSHEELMAKDGLYNKMFKSQQGWYV